MTPRTEGDDELQHKAGRMTAQEGEEGEETEGTPSPRRHRLHGHREVIAPAGGREGGAHTQLGAAAETPGVTPCPPPKDPNSRHVAAVGLGVFLPCGPQRVNGEGADPH